MEIEVRSEMRFVLIGVNADEGRITGRLGVWLLEPGRAGHCHLLESRLKERSARTLAAGRQAQMIETNSSMPDQTPVPRKSQVGFRESSKWNNSRKRSALTTTTTMPKLNMTGLTICQRGQLGAEFGGSRALLPKTARDLSLNEGLGDPYRIVVASSSS